MVATRPTTTRRRSLDDRDVVPLAMSQRGAEIVHHRDDLPFRLAEAQGAAQAAHFHNAPVQRIPGGQQHIEKSRDVARMTAQRLGHGKRHRAKRRLV